MQNAMKIINRRKNCMMQFLARREEQKLMLIGQRRNKINLRLK